jgi:hypothetical protein
MVTTLLNALQFKARCFCYSQFTAPWALKLSESDFAHFHVCERGQAWIEAEGVDRPVLMVAGDLVILPHGNAHVLRDDPKSNPISLNQLLKRRSPAPISCVMVAAGLKQSAFAARSNLKMK